jgi:hypothetical protein
MTGKLIGTRATAWLVACAAVAGTVIPRPATADDASRLVGAWRLVSWETRLDDGTTRRNRMTTGSLIYSDSGQMCAMLMDPDRAKWTGRPDDAQVRAAWDGVVAYCGRYDVHGAEGFVLHHVEFEKTPSIVGTIRKRWFTFDAAGRLTLRIDSAENGPNVAESRLVWERVSR